MKTIKLKNIKELVEILLDFDNSDVSKEYLGVKFRKDYLEIGYFEENDGYDEYSQDPEFCDDLTFALKYIKDNIISIYLTEDQDKPYCFYFEIEEPFKKVATYKIKNPNYKEEIEEKIEEDEDETVIELEWL